MLMLHPDQMESQAFCGFYVFLCKTKEMCGLIKTIKDSSQEVQQEQHFRLIFGGSSPQSSQAVLVFFFNSTATHFYIVLPVSLNAE